MPRLRDLLPSRPATPGENEGENDPGRDPQERAAEQIRFLREQELRRARTSVPPPRRG